jgi:hypothetical protein
MGANVNPTYGVVKSTLSDTQLSAEFVRTSGGNFADSFAIERPSASTSLVADTFSRSRTGGWGSAETGGPYSGTNSASFAVNGSEGTVTVPGAGRQLQATLAGIAAQDVDLRVKVKTDKPATGAQHEVSLLARNRPGIGQYRVRLGLTPGGAVTVVAQKYVASTNRTRSFGTLVTVPGLAHSAGRAIWLRAQLTGVNPTTVRIKAWADGQSEPSAWHYSATDSEGALQASGSVAILSRLPGSSTAAPVVFAYDDYFVSVP